MTTAQGVLQPFAYQDGVLSLLDQRRLPESEEYIACRSAGEAAEAIRSMAVRGAPLIGIAAAYGLVLEARRLERAGVSGDALQQALDAAAAELEAARPTAVNLSWAVRRLRAAAAAVAGPEAAVARRLEEEAGAIAAEEAAANRALSRRGADWLERNAGGGRRRFRLLSHCNTGRLATGGEGTALGIVHELWRRGRLAGVDLGETRPYLQGARLSAWELSRDGIPCRLLPDAAAGLLLQQGMVDAVVVGADRVAANGDVVNKVGTYPLAALAARHGVPFLVALPCSSFDPGIPSAAEIPVEQRPASELLEWQGRRLAPPVDVFNPAFDRTPAELVTALVCEEGVLLPPFTESIAALFGRRPGSGKDGGSSCST